MTDVSETRMNVAALKRVDPYVKDILDTATHVALYSFNEDNSEWDKTEVEGALFVYSRNGEPFHSIVIMNRYYTFSLIYCIIVVPQSIVIFISKQHFLDYSKPRFLLS